MYRQPNGDTDLVLILAGEPSQIAKLPLASDQQVERATAGRAVRITSGSVLHAGT